MSRRVFHVNYVDVLPKLVATMIVLWLALSDGCVRQRCAQAMLTVTGYLRHHPDRSVEDALRAAFAELDRDLAALLSERNRRHGGF